MLSGCEFCSKDVFHLFFLNIQRIPKQICTPDRILGSRTFPANDLHVMSMLEFAAAREVISHRDAVNRLPATCN